MVKINLPRKDATYIFICSKDLKLPNIYCNRNEKISFTNEDNLSHIQTSFSLTI